MSQGDRAQPHAAPASSALTPSFTSDRLWLPAIVLLGILLRLAQYLAHQSLWGDEAYLILNLRALSWLPLLTGPLNAAAWPQSCPPLLLAILKLLDRSPSQAEWLLRLPPLLASCAAVAATALAARRLLPLRWACFAALAMALSERLVFQAATIKQYSSDVLVAVLLLFAWSALRHRRAAPIVLATLAAAFVWLSLTVPIVYAALALALLAEREQTSQAITSWLVAQFVFAISLAALVAVSLRHQQDPLMWTLWAPALVDWHHPALVPIWLLDRLWRLFGYCIGPITNLLPAALLGTAALWHTRSRATLIALAGPIVLLVFTALARLYPLSGGRITLFLAPFEIILAAFGLAALESLSIKIIRSPWPAAAGAILLLAIPALLAARHLVAPQSKGDLRLMIRTVAESRRPAEPVYADDDEANAVISCYAGATGLTSSGLIAAARTPAKFCWLVVSHNPNGTADPAAPPGWTVDRAHSLITSDSCALHLLPVP